eukprot:1801805-Rhodomonas_salina.1
MQGYSGCNKTPNVTNLLPGHAWRVVTHYKALYQFLMSHKDDSENGQYPCAVHDLASRPLSSDDRQGQGRQCASGDGWVHQLCGISLAWLCAHAPLQVSTPSLRPNSTDRTVREEAHRSRGGGGWLPARCWAAGGTSQSPRGRPSSCDGPAPQWTVSALDTARRKPTQPGEANLLALGVDPLAPAAGSALAQHVPMDQEVDHPWDSFAACSSMEDHGVLDEAHRAKRVPGRRRPGEAARKRRIDGLHSPC